ncbi:5-methylcytosine-specific restriction enzyme A [Variovorax sp. 770b2]|nr:5-methylcytosine-specific restriction enzyme A [Variovorax sp. 770b2]
MNTMSPIHAAREYVLEAVQRPALASALPESTKAKVRNSNTWLKQFKRVGDLYAYLQRFSTDKQDGIYLEMHALGLQTFEDIVKPFGERFGDWVGDRMRASDFVIGETYSAYDILIFSANYDTRAGGMFVIESGGQPTAVVIKATLSGGRYANEWLDQGRRLKYFLKSKKLKDGRVEFGEKYKPNAAILKIPNLPVLAFVRQKAQGEFIYAGAFSKHDIRREADGSKWFDLMLASSDEVVADAGYVQQQLQDHVALALTQSQQQRLERLAKAPKKPKIIRTVATAFVRNPDVIAEVLLRAKGKCEGCDQNAPFVSKATGNPYLEVHHRKPLAQGGYDTVANALALCPNCHRQNHFG